MSWDWRGRHVLQISPQPWDDIKLSKHHYATELAGLGAHVYFVEPPKSSGPRRVTVETVEPGISVVRYATFFPYRLKFHARPLFDILMRFQAKLIRQAISAPLDLVWDFDNTYQFRDLSVFGAQRAIFHLMDAPAPGMSGDKKSDLMLSVSNHLLDAVRPFTSPAGTLPHGLGAAYADFARRELSRIPEPRPFKRVGYVGNLLNAAVDHRGILELVRAFPLFEFHFVGPADATPATPKHQADGLAELATAENVVLHGRQNAPYILDLAPSIDAWLLCYSLAHDMNQATDAHKVLEYLTMGSPVLSSWLSAYEGSSLLVMAERGSNENLAPLLHQLAADPVARAQPERDRRMRHALGYSYKANVQAVAELLDNLDPVRD